MKIPLKKRYYNKLQIMTALQDICTQEQLTGIEARLMETQCDDVEEVVWCKDCKYRPKLYNKNGERQAWNVEETSERCPCTCDDCEYNWYPDDNWFCANGERKERKGNDND